MTTTTPTTRELHEALEQARLTCQAQHPDITTPAQAERASRALIEAQRNYTAHLSMTAVACDLCGLNIPADVGRTICLRCAKHQTRS